MTLTDKIRQATFVLTVGSMGAMAGYVANDVVEVIGEIRQESAAKEEAHRQYVEIMTSRYVPPPSNYQSPEYDITFHCSGINCAF